MYTSQIGTAWCARFSVELLYVYQVLVLVGVGADTSWVVTP